MDTDPTRLTISATKPDGRLGRMLTAMGIMIVPVPGDEGNVDRYILSKRLGVERRTGGGFLKGIMDRTLFTSAVFLREHYQIPTLIVEGPVDYEHSRFDPRAVRGALSSMLIQYGLSVLSTDDAAETAELLALMARHEQCGIPEISLVPKRKATELADLQRRVVEMLPGCGMVLARELLQTFGSVASIVAADVADLRQVRGVGARKASEFHRVLHAEYEAVDTERDVEDAIELEPSLLFDRPVVLLARQHCIFTEGGEKHVVDMVYLDQGAGIVHLVELKRGKLAAPHAAQLRRYLDHAADSRLLRPLLTDGLEVRGILATVEEGGICRGIPISTSASSAWRE